MGRSMRVRAIKKVFIVEDIGAFRETLSTKLEFRRKDEILFRMTITLTKKHLWIAVALFITTFFTLLLLSRGSPMAQYSRKAKMMARSSSAPMAEMAMKSEGAGFAEPASMAQDAMGGSPGSGSGGGSLLMNSAHAAEATPGQERKLIRRGEIHFTTGDLNSVRPKLAPLVKEENAFFAGEQQHEDGGGRYLSVTIRVPWQRFEALFDKLEKLDDVKYRNISVDDVTLQHIDLTERIRNKEKLRDRYRELVGKAVAMKDILVIEQNLTRVSEEIDSSKGQLRAMDQQISLSTISLQFREPRISEVLEEPYRFWQRAKRAFVDGWFGMLGFILFFVNLWPFLLIAAGGVFWWIKKRRKS